MSWFGPREEAIPPHPRQEPRFEGELTADRIRFLGTAPTLGSGRSSSAETRKNGPPSSSSTARYATSG